MRGIEANQPPLIGLGQDLPSYFRCAFPRPHAIYLYQLFRCKPDQRGRDQWIGRGTGLASECFQSIIRGASENGIGNACDGSVEPVFKAYEDMVARQPEWVAAELAVYDLYRNLSSEVSDGLV
jgi:hypothetical protein